MSFRDVQPQQRSTLVTRHLDEEAVERYADWRETCVVVDEAYCAWSCASADERPGAFAAYRAALEQEESAATIYGAIIDPLRERFSRCLQVGEEERPAARRGPGTGVPGKPAVTAFQPIGRERSSGEELPAAGDQRVRVLIADQDGFARRMLQRIVRDVSRVVVITAARDGREALELACQYRPEVLLVDIAVPPSGGVELIHKVVPILPDARIVTLSAGADRDQAVLAALGAGAIGHIDKDTAPDQIARLVTVAADGEAIVPTRLMTRLLARWRRPPPAAGDRGAAP